MAKKQQGKVLSMQKIREILRLGLDCGLGPRSISRSCLVSHTSAGDWLDFAKKARLDWEKVKKLSDTELTRLLKPPSEAGNRRSEPDWEYIHQELKRKSVTLLLLWQEYKEQYPQDGYQLSQFYERYRQWRKNQSPVMRQEHKGGEKCFVDYAGQTVSIHDPLTGQVMQAQIFVAVLGASNYTYAEAQESQKLENWIMGHVRAYEYFGGVPHQTIPDNLKSGVTKACRYEPEINPTYKDMASYYGTAVIPARVRRPKDKAKVETAVLVVERWILARLRNHKFFSIAELNAQIALLLEDLNTRRFKKIDSNRREWFEKYDKPALAPLPEQRYEFADWKNTTVSIDYHVEVEKHYYSVPYKYCTKTVSVRYTGRTVEIFYDNVRICSHIRSYKEYFYTTTHAHMPSNHQEYANRTPQKFISKGNRIGPECEKLIKHMLFRAPRPAFAFRSCFGLLGLSSKYSPQRLEKACKRGNKLGVYSYKSIYFILKNNLDKEETELKPPEPIIMHENIRGKNYFIESTNNQEAQ